MPPRVGLKRGAAAAAAADAPKEVEAAAAARGAPKRKAASVAEAREQEAVAERKSREDKKLAADLAKAEAASRREAFDSYSSSSEGLWAWGKDCPGWKVPIASMHDRAKVLDALAKIGAPLIDDKATFDENWRFHLSVKDESAEPPSDGDEEEDEAPVDEAVVAQQQREAAAFAQAARDKKAAAAAAAAEAAAAAASAAAAATQRATAAATAVDRRPMPTRACTHCLAEAPHATPAFRCADCGMRSDLPFDAPVNVHLRGPASSASGQSISDTATARAPKEALSRRDKELERLAEEGAAYPRFDDAAAVSSAEALEGVRESLWATNYSDPSPSLIKLVRSGKLTKIGFALPTLASQAQTRADFAESGILFVNGRSETTGSVVAPLVQNWDEFTHALFSVILPALFDRPRALLDWIALARTVREISREHGWPVASRYIDAVLADKVVRRAPFGTYDNRVYDAVTKPGSVAGARASSAGTPHRGAAAAASSGPAERFVPDAHPHACRDWNFGRCNRPSCAMTHECMWIACKATDRAHPGNACAHKPPPKPRGGTAPSSVASVRSGGRGARGGSAHSRG